MSATLAYRVIQLYSITYPYAAVVLADSNAVLSNHSSLLSAFFVSFPVPRSGDSQQSSCCTRQECSVVQTLLACTLLECTTPQPGNKQSFWVKLASLTHLPPLLLCGWQQQTGSPQKVGLGVAGAAAGTHRSSDGWQQRAGQRAAHPCCPAG